MDLHLRNKTVLIAGSSQGIGFSIAEHFLEEGANVVLSGRNQENLFKAHTLLIEKYSKERVLAINADLGKETGIIPALEKTIDRFRKLDYVIANIGSGREPIGLEFNQLTLQKSFENNFMGSLLLAKLAASKMIPHKSGGIIFISSIAGVEDIVAPIAYSAHKAALNAAAKKLAKMLGPYNVRVNVIAPGNIYFKGGIWDKKLQEIPEETSLYIQTEVPLQVLGDPSDVANLALFLASEKSKFITGSIMVVDGGQTRSF